MRYINPFVGYGFDSILKTHRRPQYSTDFVVPEGQPDPQFYVDEDANKIYLWGEYNGKYTITNSGSNRSGGWSAEGKKE